MYFVEISVTGTQFVEKGASIHLVCNVTSRDDPPQSVDWFKDGSPFQTSYSRDIYIQQSVSIASKTIVSAVDISKARMSDTGVYVCRATDQLAARIKVDVLNGKRLTIFFLIFLKVILWRRKIKTTCVNG